jgi:hypothetical protein
MSSAVQMSAPQRFASNFSGEVDVRHLCGATYKGQIKNGKRHGQGLLTYENGITYHGNFKDNNIHGDGILIFPNGDTFTGHFKNNVLLPEQYGDYDFSDGSRLCGKPEGKMSEFLKQSLGNPQQWPPRFYCPVSRHISTEQHALMIAINDEIITEKRCLLRFADAAAKNDSHPTKFANSRKWLGEREEDVKKYESLAQGWYDNRTSELVKEQSKPVAEKQTNTRYDYDYDPDNAGYERALEDLGFNQARKEGLERLAKKEERRRAKRRAAGLDSGSEEEEEEEEN